MASKSAGSVLKKLKHACMGNFGITSGALTTMKQITLDSLLAHPDVSVHALEKRLAEMIGDDETVLILLGKKPVAALISLKQLKLLEYAEERVLDDIDLKESETILKDPKWISWDEVEKQCRS
ncbi:MAG: hypothetical protein WCA59_13215 [Candidatus Binataceae bacterium]